MYNYSKDKNQKIWNKYKKIKLKAILILFFINY